MVPEMKLDAMHRLITHNGFTVEQAFDWWDKHQDTYCEEVFDSMSYILINIINKDEREARHKQPKDNIPQAQTILKST